METGLESQITHGMKPSTCTKAEGWAIFRRYRMQHMMQDATLHLCFTVVWVVESNKFPAHIYRGTSGLAAEYFNCFFTLHNLRKLQIAFLKLNERASNLHPFLSFSFSHSCLQGGSRQSASVCANPSPLVELHRGWIWLIALAWKDPKGGSYQISWLPPSVNINHDSCTVSKLFGWKESALTPYAYYKGCFQQHATVISGAQLGNFNPLLSSLGLLVMQPAFTQHNGSYLPMCFEGYC